MARYSVLISAIEPFQKEAVNGEGSDLSPGEMVSWSSTKGEVEYPGAAGDAGFLVVVDKYDVALDGSYADGEQVFFHAGQSGEEYFVDVAGILASDGTDSAIDPGDELANYTDGTLCFADAGEPVAVAKEGVSSSGSDQIKVEVL